MTKNSWHLQSPQGPLLPPIGLRMGPPSAPLVAFLKWDQIFVFQILAEPFENFPDIPIPCFQQPIIVDKIDQRQLRIVEIPRSEIGSISTCASCWLTSRTTEVSAKEDDIN